MRVIPYYLFVSLFTFSLSAHAQLNSTHDELRNVYPPHHIKPNTSPLVPTGYSPAQMRTAYGLGNFAKQGEGQVIAIVDAFDNPNAEADFAVFNSTFQLPACTTANGCFEKVYATGTKPAGDTRWGLEIALDIEWAHAIAPKAKILLVEAGASDVASMFQAVNVAIQKGATVVSMSWGAGEWPGQTQYDAIFNVPGIAFTASSGDSGTGIIYPSSAPSVIAVGGTTLHLDSSGKYISESAWSGSGGGLSTVESVPAHQSQFPIPNNPNKRRGIPDVSYNADPATAVPVYCTYGGFGWSAVGGTSAGAPQWAGLIAIAKSNATKPITNLNAMLYTLAKQNYDGFFHDITTGTNGSCGYYCTAQKGYDYVTGIGTPIGTALIPALIGGGTPPTGDCTITSTCNTWGTPQDPWAGSSCNFVITKPSPLASPTVVTMTTKGISALTSVWNATATLVNSQVTATLSQPQFVPSFGFNAAGIISLPSTTTLTSGGKQYNCTLN